MTTKTTTIKRRAPWNQYAPRLNPTDERIQNEVWVEEHNTLVTIVAILEKRVTDFKRENHRLAAALTIANRRLSTAEDELGSQRKEALSEEIATMRLTAEREEARDEVERLLAVCVRVQRLADRRGHMVDTGEPIESAIWPESIDSALCPPDCHRPERHAHFGQTNGMNWSCA